MTLLKKNINAPLHPQFRQLKKKSMHYAPAKVIVMGFVLLILLGAALLCLPMASKNGISTFPVNALFTATSAVCVTGLVVVDTSTHWSVFGQTVIVLLIQIGGLGIMSVATFFWLLTGKKVGFKERLAIQESLSDFSLSGVVKTLKKVLLATLMIEMAGACLLSFRLIPLYGFGEGIRKSIFHSISAFCNAGFDIFGSHNNEFTSLTAFKNDPLILLPICFLFIIGGLGFIVLRDIITVKKFSKLMLHTKVVFIATSFLILSGTLLIFLYESTNPLTMGNMSFPTQLLNSFFHSTTPRTAGFNTLSIGDMTEGSKFITILLMLIGAAPGSTAGGIKITTVYVIFIAVLANLKGQEDVNILHKRVSPAVISKALSIMVLSLSIVVITTLVLLANQEGSFVEALFESSSAFGTAGLSTGITPHLSTISKLQIILTMFLGRVGPISAALSLTLRQGSNKQLYKYPEGKITVG